MAYVRDRDVTLAFFLALDRLGDRWTTGARAVTDGRTRGGRWMRSRVIEDRGARGDAPRRAHGRAMRTIDATRAMRMISIARLRASDRSCDSRARVGDDAMGAGGDRWKGFSPRGGRGRRWVPTSTRATRARVEDTD